MLSKHPQNKSKTKETIQKESQPQAMPQFQQPQTKLKTKRTIQIKPQTDSNESDGNDDSKDSDFIKSEYKEVDDMTHVRNMDFNNDEENEKESTNRLDNDGDIDDEEELRSQRDSDLEEEGNNEHRHGKLNVLR